MVDRPEYPINEVPAGARAWLAAFLNKARQWVSWVISFFQEVYSASIAFWDRPAAKRSNDILLSLTSFAIILFARKTHAAYDHFGYSALALASVALASAGLACFGCGCDPKSRTSYQSNATECYRVLTLGVLLSALFICTNHITPWAEMLSYKLGFQDDTQEQLWLIALPAAIFSYAVLLGNSLFDPEFRGVLLGKAQGSTKYDRLRIGLWSVFFIGSFWLLNLLMFGFAR